MKILVFVLFVFPVVLQSQSITLTFESGDIPTSLNAFDPTCNGPISLLAFTLPSGSVWNVTGIDIEYAMTAQGGGWKSQQRSQLYCQNSSTSEEVFSGTGNSGGIQAYSRSGVSIANGVYAPGSVITLEMRCWRTANGSGCNTTFNKVNNFTWILTLHYQAVPDDGRVGIGTNNPDTSAILEINSIHKGFLPPRMAKLFRDGIPNPAEGLMVYCTDCSPEGIYFFNGSEWKLPSTKLVRDGDGDTFITVEQNTDEDKIRMSTANVERLIIEPDGDIGINVDSATAKLDINGKLKLGDDGHLPHAGMIRWNEAKQDFEGFNGNVWVSLTQSYAGWGQAIPYDVMESLQIAQYNEFEQLGTSISMTADRLIVGAPFSSWNLPGGEDGKAYSFHWNGIEWEYDGEVLDENAESGDHFGTSVGVYGDYFIAGVPDHNTYGNVDQGKALIFDEGPMGGGVIMLEASDGEAGDHFGSAVAIYGDYAIVGAKGNDINGIPDLGQAYIFKRNGMFWEEEAILADPDGTEGAFFGSSVAIHGDYVIVGAPQHNEGRVIVYKRNGTVWPYHATLEPFFLNSPERFGESVAMTNDYILVGAPLGGNSQQGTCYTFKRNGNVWNEHQTITAFDDSPSAFFGTSVSMQSGHICIGAPGHPVQAAVNRGKAYVFKLSGIEWIQESMLVSSDGAAQDKFGTAVAIAPQTAVTVAPGHDSPLFLDVGKIYMYQRN